MVRVFAAPSVHGFSDPAGGGGTREDPCTGARTLIGGGASEPDPVGAVSDHRRAPRRGRRRCRTVRMGECGARSSGFNSPAPCATTRQVRARQAVPRSGPGRQAPASVRALPEGHLRGRNLPRRVVHPSGLPQRSPVPDGGAGAAGTAMPWVILLYCRINTRDRAYPKRLPHGILLCIAQVESLPRGDTPLGSRLARALVILY